MTMTRPRGEILRPVPADAIDTTRMGAFLRSAEARTGTAMTSHDELWQWSVEHPADFWQHVIDTFDLMISGIPGPVLADPAMPGARWLPGARLSYPAHALRAEWSGPALVGLSQTRNRVELSFAELRDQVARCRTGLAALGVGPGDRVAGYLPHVPETVVAFLATASLGAVWICCPPEFGARAVIDRLSQVDPVVLIAVDGHRYGNKEIDRRPEVAAIRDALPTLRHTVTLPYLHGDAAPDDSLSWSELLREPGPLEFTPVPFDHPLYILFSSGTTGLPKAIVHGHGGILLEHHKSLGLHNDVHAGDRFFWFSTTGWMMWNYAVSALLLGATVVCFDGNPAWPDADALWAVTKQERLTYFGTSAGFLMNCRSAGLTPAAQHDLSSLRGIGSTGSPLPAEGYRWVHEQFGPQILLNSASGGTDVCSAFVGASPLLPVRAGEIPGRMLGCAVHALDPSGRPVIDEPGELSLTSPLPSMPVGLWGDADGSRFRDTYFGRWPGIWTHGDWVTFTADGACTVSGRSDATLNRGGVRLGTSDFYTIVEDIPAIADSLVVHLEDQQGGAGTLVLFVVAEPSAPDRSELREEIVRRLRSDMSPRHVPDEIVWLPALPKTLSGKKLETPVKRLLMGARSDDVAARDSLGHPEALLDIERWRDGHPQLTPQRPCRSETDHREERQ
ncbi:acetoacetate--CoA ligase [Streptomyces sp. NPDC001812]|uniref:acetoacetate--CoA ligase n=1 Tax=Streptomyces sp. NPDC001812 TaxID=3364611 RepID=UPI0036B3A749